METIKEYLRLLHGVVGACLAYIIRKAIIVLTYGDNSKYVTPDNEMIARMLHLSPDRHRIHNE